MTDNISSIIHKPTKDTSEETFLKGFFLVTYVLLIPLHVATIFHPNIRMILYVVLAVDGIAAYRLVLITAAKQVWEAKVHSVVVVGAGFLGLNILVTIIGFILKLFGFTSDPSQNETNITELLHSNAAPFLLILGLGVAGPIVEELVFRQFLIGFLERYIPMWAAIAISSLLFGLIHMHGFTTAEWFNVWYYSAMGLAFSLIYALDRNVYMPIAVHVWLNLPLALATVP